jgi:mannan endo-1,6-alpha-mannosidase
MSEVACETPQPQTCNYDQPSFKAYLSRWMAMTSRLVPDLAPNITSRLQTSAAGAALQCSGQGKNACGRRWYQNVWDGFTGVGEQMSAMSVFQNNLIHNFPGPLTADKGGTSKSDPDAGSGTGEGSANQDPTLTSPITTADKAGAGILTLISLVLVIGGTSWMVIA